MDGMHAIGIHIIRKAAAAADPGYDHDILAGNTQGRHYFLHLCQDGIITASRTPSHFLVSGKILGCQWGYYCGFTHNFGLTTNLQQIPKCSMRKIARKAIIMLPA
jgi:hypothetical protein